MPNPGFSNRGFYADKFMFGGGHNFEIFTSGWYTRADELISAPTHLTEDLIAHSLNITSTVYVDTNRIIARDTITISGSGAVIANGAPSAGTAGGAYSGSKNGLHEGFRGGTGAPLISAGTEGYGSQVYGLATSHLTLTRTGGSGGTAYSGTYAAGLGGGYSTLGTACGKSNIYQSSIFQAARVLGPTGGNPDSSTLETYKVGGGAGGGGGGSSPTEEGFGGGAGGGVIWIAADKIILDTPHAGTIASNGGSTVSRSSTAGNGGGGQGGVVILVCNELIFANPLASINVYGGAAGGGNGDSRDGSNGGYGRVLVFSSQCVQDFCQDTVTAADWEIAKDNYKTP